MLALTLLPMAPTPSDVVDANGCPLSAGGPSETFASGVVGAPNSPT
jgi:hypothetical protein